MPLENTPGEPVALLVRREFRVHRLNAEGLAGCDALARAFSSVLDVIDQLSPAASRERSLAVTRLEEASAWAKRSLAQNPNFWLEQSNG